MKIFDNFKRAEKSISKDDKYNGLQTNFTGFFVMLGRKFWNISTLNLLYVLCNFPIFFYLFTLTGKTKQEVVTVSSPMFSSLYGFMQAGFDSVSSSQVFPFVNAFVSSYVPTTLTYVLYGISALALITFGLSNAGAAYCTRGFVRQEPIFLWSDFFYCIKKNFVQAFLMGIIDIAISVVLVWDFLFWNGRAHLSFMNGVSMYFSLFLCVLYFFMRFYIYTLLITFDLSIFKILKNSFLMAFLGLKRNFICLLAILFVFYINVQLFLILPSFGIMLPVIITISLLMFISTYCSYPVVKKYMIDPFYPESDDASYSDDADESIFEDRG